MKILKKFPIFILLSLFLFQANFALALTPPAKSTKIIKLKKNTTMVNLVLESKMQLHCPDNLSLIGSSYIPRGGNGNRELVFNVVVDNSKMNELKSIAANVSSSCSKEILKLTTMGNVCLGIWKVSDSVTLPVANGLSEVKVNYPGWLVIKSVKELTDN